MSNARGRRGRGAAAVSLPHPGPARMRSRRGAQGPLTAALSAALLGGSAPVGGHAAAGAAPFTVVERKEAPEVRLAPALARVVKQRFPGYRLPRPIEEDPQLRVLCRERHPELRVSYAALGDFDGDGRTDAALHLRREKSRDAGIVVAFHATGAGGFVPVVVDREQRYGANFCLARVRPGVIEYLRLRGDEILSPPGKLRLRHDGLRFSVPEAVSRVYYWDGKRYRFVETGE